MAKQAPVHQIKHGGVRAAIWQNKGQNGDYYAVTFERSYKTGETWKRTNSYGFHHLQALTLCIEEAQLWVSSQGQSANRA